MNETVRQLILEFFKVVILVKLLSHDILMILTNCVNI